ncbi:Phosphatidylinositol 4-kinase alpha 1 [Chlorella vulgaris]
MVRAQQEWAEDLAERQPLTAEDVSAFVNSLASSMAAAANGRLGEGAAAALESLVPLSLFLSKSLGKFPDVVVPSIVHALQAVVDGIEALADDPERATTSSDGLLPASRWGALLARVMAELDAVLSLLLLHADWKAQISAAFSTLLRQLLAVQQQETPMLSGFRATLLGDRRRLPLVGADAAQLFLHISQTHLGLLSSSGTPAASASKWRRAGDLPWSLAGQLAPLALSSGQLSAEQASRVALGACAAIEQLLRPVLVPDDGASEASAFVQGNSSPHPHPPAALPTPAFVTSIASLASQTACSLGEQLGANGSSNGGSTSNGGAGLAAAASVADTLLSVCEDCVAAVVELGVGDRASDALLAICLGISRQLLPLLATEGQLDGNALADLLPRLQALLSGTARLSELEYFLPGGEGTTCQPGGAGSPPGTFYDAEVKMKSLWVWDLSRNLSEVAAGAEQDPSLRKRPAWWLTRTLSEGTACLLAAAWRRSPAAITTTFVPLAGSALDRPEAVPTLGRMLALAGGDEGLARLVVPLLRDVLASQTSGAEAEAYAVAAHSLASMAVCCAVNGRRWGYDTVVDLLIKLYKVPNFSISRALLHGTDAASPATPAAKGAPAQGPDVPITGRCPGALADALLRLAEGLRGAPLVVLKDLRTRLLTLFTDFALILPNPTYVKDLGALLPALGAAGEAVHTAAAGVMSTSQSVADLSLDALNTAQEEDLLVLKLFRQLWLYCGVYDFAGLKAAASAQHGSSGRWPAEWRQAAGRVAAVSPLLIVGWEQYKPDELLESLTSEFGSRLAKLGPLGESAALTSALSALLGPDLAAPGLKAQLPAPMAAHLLTQAAKSLCRARFSSYEACAEGSVPVYAPLRHLQLALPGSSGYAWQQLVAQQVFGAFKSRLAADRLSLSRPAERDALDACAQQLAQVLVSYLVQQGPNAEVPRLADRLLAVLLEEFPALQYKRDVLAAMFEAAHQEEAGPDGLPQQRLAFAWLSRLLQQTAAEAPGPTEANLCEQMQGAPAIPGDDAAEVMGRYMPEVLQMVRTARERFPMAALHRRMVRGAMAWSTKLHFLGRVAGLAESCGAEDSPSACVPLQCAKMLSGALRQRHTDRALADLYLQAAAALVRYPGSPVSRQLLRLLCWVPTKRFSAAVMRVAVLAWHWVMAAGGQEAQVALLAEQAEAWCFTVRARLGLFADAVLGPLHARAAPSAEAPTGVGSGGGGGGGDGGGDGGGKDPARPHLHAADVAAAADAVEAHHLWVAFLWEVTLQLRHDLSSLRGQVAGTVWRQLSTALHDPSASLTTLPASAGARFRLLALALSLCQEQHGAASRRNKPCPLPVLLLYEQVLAAALQWFELPEAWHDGDGDMLREALGAVKQFAEMVGTRQLPQLPRDLPPPHPVWGPMPAPKSNEARQALLAMLLSAEVERLAAWADPLAAGSVPPSAATSLSAGQWAAHVRTAWAEVCPRLAVALARRFPQVPAIKGELQRLVALDAGQEAVQSLPEAALLLATPAAAKANAPQLQHLAEWAPLPLLEAMELAGGAAGRHPAVLAYVMRSLEACLPEEVAFFLPQLVQLLRFDQGSSGGGSGGLVERFLLDAAARSVYFAHMLVCQLLSEGTPPDEAFNPAVKRSNWAPPADTGLWGIADRVRQRLLAELHGDVQERLEAELSFFNAVTEVSGKLYPVPKASDERKAAAVRFLHQVALPRTDLYIPTNPDCRVVALIPESAAPMQSAAKCPILAAFLCEQSDELGSHEKVQACIFKVGDDCRQDVLALQVMRLLKGAFDGAGLPLYLAPYGVVPTGHEQGIIEVIPQSKSRAQLGEMFDGGLLEIFQHEFGLPGSRRFEAARQRFLESTAAYSVASYLLWAKDRHNGNLMLDNQGRFLHIDFGYILGISPGGNLGFETAPFKLSYEMTQLLDPGATRDSPTFRRFMELTIRGFLAARSVADSIVAVVSMMVPSQLPCFSHGKPVDSLRARFRLDLSDAAAAAYMQGLVLRSYDKWTTGGYDYIQYLQNAIPK